MKYTKIELKGYQRIKLNNIQLIRIEPKEIIQMILGTNGSGKTSLLREITPLPSPTQQYEKGGYKLLELTHNNSFYKVINSFDGKNTKYSLIKDNVDIFEGSTATDFKTLIKQEFGLTPEIQTLIDGVAKFSTMDISKRRYWFTLLSNSDYTFAFEYYGKIRSRIRDLQGAFTINQNRYVSELSKVLSEDDVKNTKNKLKIYQDILNKLLEDKPRVDRLKNDIETSIIDNDHKLKYDTDLLISIRLKLGKLINGYNKYLNLDLESCKKLIYKLTAKYEQELNSEKLLRKLLEEKHDISNNLIRISNHSVEELNRSKNEIIEQILHARNSVSTINLNNPLFIENSIIVFQSSFESVYQILRDIFDQFPYDGIENLDRGTRIQQLQRLETLEQNLKVLNEKIKFSQNKITELEYIKVNHERICPNCSHRWIHGYDDSIYISTKIKLNGDIENYEKIIQEKDIIIGLVKEYDRINGLINQYRQVIQSWPNLNPLWELLRESGTYHPKTLNNVLESVLRDLPFLLRIETLTNKVREYDELLNIAKKESNSDLNSNKIKMEQLEFDLSEVQNRIRFINKELENLKRYLELMETSKTIANNIELTLINKEKDLSEIEATLRAEHFNRLIYIFRQEVSILEQSISKINIQETVINQLVDQGQQYKDEIRLLKLAEQAMSPSTGLIAKGLTGFINLFIGRMNHFVKHIWSYPLEILPVSINEDLELDYKFPVEIDNRFKAPDIKAGECNNSTIEVFDLAFRIAAMECLGLTNYPLQLDEFGSSFDHNHRNVAFQVVTGLTTSTDITQIFMVSHAEQSYGSLKNADTIVLHSDNIIIPEGININNQTYIN